MINQSGAAPAPGFLRRVVLIAIAAIVLVMAWVAVALSQDQNPDYYTYPPKGVVKPEGFAKYVDPRSHVITVYEETLQQKAAVFTRDRKSWLVMKTAANGDIQIFDAATTNAKPIIVIPASQAVKAMRETR
jgi:hypothetical protein